MAFERTLPFAAAETCLCRRRLPTQGRVTAGDRVAAERSETLPTPAGTCPRQSGGLTLGCPPRTVIPAPKKTGITSQISFLSLQVTLNDKVDQSAGCLGPQPLLTVLVCRALRPSGEHPPAGWQPWELPCPPVLFPNADCPRGHLELPVPAPTAVRGRCVRFGVLERQLFARLRRTLWDVGF